MRSIVSLTARSLPGIGVAEKMTVSPVVEPHLRVVVMGHAAQGRQRLALAAGREITSFSSGKSSISRGPRACPRARRYGPASRPMFDVLAHRAAHQRDLAAEGGRGVHHLLNAVDVRGEAGDHDPALAAGEGLLEARARRSPRRATCRGGRRWWSPRRAAAAPRGRARRAGARRREHRRPGSGRTCSPRSPASCRARRSGRRANESGIECAIFTISTPNGPASKLSPASTSCTSTSRSLCSSSFERTIAAVSGPP